MYVFSQKSVVSSLCGSFDVSGGEVLTSPKRPLSKRCGPVIYRRNSYHAGLIVKVDPLPVKPYSMHSHAHKIKSKSPRSFFCSAKYIIKNMFVSKSIIALALLSSSPAFGANVEFEGSDTGNTTPGA